MLVCKVGNNKINCYDGTYSEKELRTWSKKRILICPVCGNPYEYCHGRVTQPYFRHKDKKVCEDVYSEPETEEHLQGKRDLFEWIKKQDGISNAELEAWLPETHQRPDITFKYHGRKYVLEYQCTPIATEYYERHDLYQAAGIKDIWICGTEKYFQFYHKGNGNKQICEIEDKSRVYYDSKNKCIYKVDHKISYLNFMRIISNQTYVHKMKNPYDYRINEENFYLLKDYRKSYKSKSYYPSPTGKPSNKYPYPVTEYYFDENKSLAKCMALRNLKLKKIK